MTLSSSGRTNVTRGRLFPDDREEDRTVDPSPPNSAASIGGGSTSGFAPSDFGHYLGRAFQLQDDLLDVVADERSSAKTIGGDIVEGKGRFFCLNARSVPAGTTRLTRAGRSANRDGRSRRTRTAAQRRAHGHVSHSMSDMACSRRPDARCAGTPRRAIHALRRASGTTGTRHAPLACRALVHRAS